MNSAQSLRNLTRRELPDAALRAESRRAHRRGLLLGVAITTGVFGFALYASRPGVTAMAAAPDAAPATAPSTADDVPSTKPVEPRDPRGGGPRVRGARATTSGSAHVTANGGGNPGGGPQGAAGMGGDIRITDEEWRDAEAFAIEHLPNRYAYFQKLAEDKKPQVKRSIVGRYRLVQRFKDLDKDLTELLVKQADLDDQALGLAMELTGRPRDGGPDNIPQLEAKLREVVSKIVTNGLQEREMRLDKLKESLGKEQSELASDKDRVNDLIAERIERYRNFDPDHPFDRRRIPGQPDGPENRGDGRDGHDGRPGGRGNQPRPSGAAGTDATPDRK